MVNKAGSLKLPDFSDPWDAVKLFGKWTKQIGSDAIKKNNSVNNANSNDGDTKGPMVWDRISQSNFDTSGKSQYIKPMAGDSSLYFNPGANNSNNENTPDTGRVITFPNN